MLYKIKKNQTVKTRGKWKISMFDIFRDQFFYFILLNISNTFNKLCPCILNIYAIFVIFS